MTSAEMEYKNILKDGEVIAENYKYNTSMTDEEFDQILHKCFRNYGEGTFDEFVQHFIDYKKAENSFSESHDFQSLVENYKNEIEKAAQAAGMSAQDYIFENSRKIVKSATEGISDHREYAFNSKAINTAISELMPKVKHTVGVTGPVYDDDSKPSYFI